MTCVKCVNLTAVLHVFSARRGPMDEMRQLVRIMVKLIPDSGAVLVANEGEGLGGGGK